MGEVCSTDGNFIFAPQNEFDKKLYKLNVSGILADQL